MSKEINKINIEKLNNSDYAHLKQQKVNVYRNGEYIGNLSIHKSAKFTEEEYTDLINDFINKNTKL